MAAANNWNDDFTEEDVTKSLSLNLAEMRAKKGLTQKQIANVMCYNHTFICKIEKGITGATLTTALRLASVLGCTLDELLRRRTPQRPQTTKK